MGSLNLMEVANMLQHLMTKRGDPYWSLGSKHI